MEGEEEEEVGAVVEVVVTETGEVVGEEEEVEVEVLMAEEGVEAE